MHRMLPVTSLQQTNIIWLFELILHHSIIWHLRRHATMRQVLNLTIHGPLSLSQTWWVQIWVNVIHDWIDKAILINFAKSRLLHVHHWINILIVIWHSIRSLHIWLVAKLTLMLMSLCTMHVLIHRLSLLHVSIPVIHTLIILPNSLRGIIHFNGASIKLFSVHFLQCSL